MRRIELIVDITYIHTMIDKIITKVVHLMFMAILVNRTHFKCFRIGE